MPEQKRELTIFGKKHLVTDVPVSKASESFSYYELEDGSSLRVKAIATAFLRIDGEFTAEGKPVYIVMTSPNSYVISSTIQQPTEAALLLETKQ